MLNNKVTILGHQTLKIHVKGLALAEIITAVHEANADS